MASNFIRLVVCLVCSILGRVYLVLQRVDTITKRGEVGVLRFVAGFYIRNVVLQFGNILLQFFYGFVILTAVYGRVASTLSGRNPFSAIAHIYGSW